MQQERLRERRNHLTDFFTGAVGGAFINFQMTRGADIGAGIPLERQLLAFGIAATTFATGIYKKDMRLVGAGVGIAGMAAYHFCREMSRQQQSTSGGNTYVMGPQ